MASDSEEIDEQLDELDHNIKRLRIEYDQYFMGALKRAPEVLQGRVQKSIVRFASSPPRNTAQRFRFNQLNSKFQMFRQQWGRNLRQMETGQLASQRFRMRQRDSEATEAATPAPPSRSTAPERKKGGAPIDKLCHALSRARRKTGEHGGEIDRTRLQAMVRKQAAALRGEHDFRHEGE